MLTLFIIKRTNIEFLQFPCQKLKTYFKISVKENPPLSPPSSGVKSEFRQKESGKDEGVHSINSTFTQMPPSALSCSAKPQISRTFYTPMCPQQASIQSLHNITRKAALEFYNSQMKLMTITNDSDLSAMKLLFNKPWHIIQPNCQNTKRFLSF